jgi:peptidoglycan/LPS O-acetylase OafA/YrhL
MGSVEQATPAASTRSTPRSLPRLPAGNGLRAVAAGMVFLHHASFLTGTTYNSRAGALLARFDVGVAVFFALSGFLLSRPFVAALLDDTPLPDSRTFYMRRLLRVVPAYWVALTVTYVWLRPDSAKLASGLDFPLHYLFLQIYPGDTFQKGITPAWTLAVEMSFYAALPLLAVAAMRLVRGRATSQRALLLLAALGGVTVLSVLWRAVVYGAHLPEQMVLWLPGSIDQFAVGIALAVVAMWSERRAVVRPAAAWFGRFDLLWWLIAAALLVFSSSQLDLARGLDRASWYQELLRHGIYSVFGGLLLLPVAFGPPDRGLVRRALQSRPLFALGLVSYGFFLWHVPLIESALRLTDRPVFLDWSKGIGLLSRDVLVPTALALALALGAAWLTYVLVERPAQRVGRGIRPPKAPVPMAPARPSMSDSTPVPVGDAER